MSQLPKWVDNVVIPVLSVCLAMLCSVLVVLIIGESPQQAAQVLFYGAFGNAYNFGFTLYYTTNFIFTGLAVAVAFHAGLFNIGGEGQALVGGIGAALVGLWLDTTSWLLVLMIGLGASFLFGAFWAAIPAYLQAKRGSHIVITTIMFNYIAAGLLVALLSNLLKPVGSDAPQTRQFSRATHFPRIDEFLSEFGIDVVRMEANILLLVATLAALVVWLFLWRSRLGYEVRMFGHTNTVSDYSGQSRFKITMVVMVISGGLAGLMATNAVLGQQHQLSLGFVGGAGFTGIAVSLIGRSHPLGVIFAALLFGALFQGGAELSFEIPTIPAKMIFVIQALVILFVGAMENLLRYPLEALHRLIRVRSA